MVARPETPIGRRHFLKGAALSVFGAMAGIAVPFQRNLSVAYAQDTGQDFMSEKPGLVLLGDKPLNAETPAHLLDDDVTPYERMFVRMNGLVPQSALDQNAKGWKLTVDGEVEKPLELSIDDLKSKFETVTRRLVVECSGNGRSFFQPEVTGNQWTTGGVGCPEWTGVRLADVLAAARVKPNAVYTGHYGNDVHLSGDTAKIVISRGVPIAKALEPDALIAWAMNGEPLRPLHGFPLRLIVPGYPASVSHKYLTRIWIRDKEHDGEKMTGFSYRVPAHPVAPGTDVAESAMEILTVMPVKSLITLPQTGADATMGQATEIRGHAWSGSGDVRAIHASIDFGQSWIEAKLEPSANKFAWQRWRANVTLPEPGYYEVWARATDLDGKMQPPVVPGWNPQGYGNNMQHRIALFAR